MLANLQRLIVLSLVTAGLIWVGGCLYFGDPGLAVVGALFLLFGHSAVLAVEMILTKWVPDALDTPRSTLRECLTAWLGEVIANLQVFCWRQPFRSHAWSDVLPAQADGRRGVVLVHGFVCNRGFWNPWLERLGERGVSVIAPDLEPPFASIGQHAAAIDRAVARMQEATGALPVLVAHSMGGLAVRYWMQSSKAKNRVHHVITIGTPHRGTWLARFARRIPGTEMAQGSEWLCQLDDRRDLEAPGRFTCFYGNADNVVFPASSGQLSGADNRLIRATAHVQLAYHQSVWQCVMERLADATPHHAL